MGEKGLVMSIEGDEATVLMERTEACAKCRACIAGMTTKDMILKVKNECDARADDWVNIELDVKYAINAVLIMYGVPLFCLLTGILAGYLGAGFAGVSNYQELIACAAGVGFMFLAYRWIASREKRINKVAYTPVATAIVNAEKN